MELNTKSNISLLEDGKKHKDPAQESKNSARSVQSDEIKRGKDNFREQEDIKSYTLWLDRSSFRIALFSSFTALAIVLGYLLAFLPNIEVFTMMLFLSGFILGKRDGFLIGAMSSFIFCFFNPLGTSPLPLLMLQMGYYSSVGLAGGVSSSFLSGKEFFNPEKDLYVVPTLVFFGLVAFLLTLTFDVLSTVILALSVFGNLDAFLPNYLFGLPFSIIHLVNNVLLFIFVLPALISIIYNMLDLSKDGKER